MQISKKIRCDNTKKSSVDNTKKKIVDLYPKIGNCSNNYQGDLIFTAKNISV